MEHVSLREWKPPSDAARLESDLDMLAGVLHAVVHAGASVNFILPFPVAEARRFWSGKVLPAVAAGRCRLWVAKVDGQIAGTVILDLDTPPNQAHRGEVRKLLVDPAWRRRGIARALMAAIEDAARAEGRTLLTLDTVTGSQAEPLYLSLGYRLAGVIPGYARTALTPMLEPTSLMYKELI